MLCVLGDKNHETVDFQEDIAWNASFKKGQPFLYEGAVFLKHDDDWGNAFCIIPSEKYGIGSQQLGECKVKLVQLEVSYAV